MSSKGGLISFWEMGLRQDSRPISMESVVYDGLKALLILLGFHLFRRLALKGGYLLKAVSS
jgi:hypothetical protein